MEALDSDVVDSVTRDLRPGMAAIVEADEKSTRPSTTSSNSAADTCLGRWRERSAGSTRHDRVVQPRAEFDARGHVDSRGAR